jgi:hypothetical protein
MEEPFHQFIGRVKTRLDSSSEEKATTTMVHACRRGLRTCSTLKRVEILSIQGRRILDSQQRVELVY